MYERALLHTRRRKHCFLVGCLFASAALRLCVQVVAPAPLRRAGRSAARPPGREVVVRFLPAAGLCPRKIHAGISGRRRRGRRSGAFLRVQACRPARPTSVSSPVAHSAPGERSASRRPAWSRAADLFCPTFAHHTRRPAPVSSAITAVPALRAGVSVAGFPAPR